MAQLKDTVIEGVLKIQGKDSEGKALILPEESEIYIGNEPFKGGVSSEEIQQMGFVTNNELDQKDFVTNDELDQKDFVTNNELDQKDFVTNDELDQKDFVTNNELNQKNFVIATKVGGNNLGLVKNGGNVVIRADGSMESPLSDGAISYLSEGAYSFATNETSHAKGSYSFATGKSTNAYGYNSYTEGALTVTRGEHSHAEGHYSKTTETGFAAHAEGYYTEASGSASHAEGSKTNAIGLHSHAEGSSSKTYGDHSHAEGHKSETAETGYAAHAEGNQTHANGNSSHSEGNGTTASGDRSHAEGFYTVASNISSHAEGHYTISNTFCLHVQGKYNIKGSGEKYAHIVGNGSKEDVVDEGGNIIESNRSNAHTLDWQGNATFAGIVSSKGEDYAEFFEWLDGNPDSEDRVGLLVTLDGEKIRLANQEDEILGIISGTVAVLGGNYEWEWNGKYLTDDFGRVIYDMVEEFTDEIVGEDEEGNPIIEKQSLGFFKHPRINPKYNPTQEYVNRADRPEWDTVGMLGKLYVRDDGTCIPNYYATVGGNGIATLSLEKTNMRVLSRVNENIVRVLLK